jgi:predicted nucleic acid-binding protein
VKKIILDSSVIAKWFFPESGSEKALELKEQFAKNELSIAIPVLFYYEMNNILRTAIKSYRIETEDATKAFAALTQLNFIAYSSIDLLSETLTTALRYDISSYDASYVALAEELQVPFMTADQKLLKRVKNKLVIGLQ